MTGREPDLDATRAAAPPPTGGGLEGTARVEPPRFGPDGLWKQVLADGRWREGARVGDLVLGAKLGQGGMGAVWEARDVVTGARRAVKTIPLAADPEALRRFEREGLAQAAVDAHENVVRVHAAGQGLGHAYLVMDLAAGGDLAGRLRAGPLPLAEAVRIVTALARGLEHVHRRGVLHRDIKPQNVLFDEDDRPQLVDFGLARVADEEALTRTGALLGTPAYLAPEQARGKNHEVDERTDVYGLGAVLYQCLTGRPPFAGPSAHAVLMRVVAGDPPPAPSSIVPDLPREADAVCRRALARERRDRFPDARSFGEAVAALGASGARPRRTAPALLLVAAVTAAATGGALALRSGESAAAAGPAPVVETPAVAPQTATTEARPPLPQGLVWRGDEVVNARDGAVLLWVPPGEFSMGYPTALRTYNDSPPRRVELSGYWIGKYEVTWAQFRAFCAATGRAPPGPPSKLAGVDVSEHPVVNVTWADAREYCAWAGLRLPTEAEWERTARGLDGRLFPWGDDPPSKERLNGSLDGLPATTPVGSFPRGASATGCLDMAGNAWEWVEDTYDVFYYTLGPTKDPCSRAAGPHLVRGGGWNSGRALVFAPLRWQVAPEKERGDAHGFRVARSGPGP